MKNALWPRTLTSEQAQAEGVICGDIPEGVLVFDQRACKDFQEPDPVPEHHYADEKCARCGEYRCDHEL